MIRTIFTILLLTLTGLPLSAATHPDADGFIADWLISGPYPSYVVAGKDTGLNLDPLNGESTIRPWPGMPGQATFKVDESKLIVALDITNEWGVRKEQHFNTTWKAEHFATPNNIVMNRKFLPIDDHFAFYAACYIESPTTRNVKFRLGVDDEHKLYLNGQLLGQAATSQAVRPDTFIYPAKLERGLNFLLLKVVDRTFDCGFCLAVTGLDNAPQTDLHLHTDSPARRLGADLYDQGFGLSFDFGGKTLYDSEPVLLKLRFFAPNQQNYRLTLGNQSMTVKSGNLLDLSPSLKKGLNRLTCIVTNPAGQTVAEFCRDITVYSRHDLLIQQQEAQRQLTDLQKKNAIAKQEIDHQTQLVDQAQKRLQTARTQAEEKYTRERLKAQQQARCSVNLPFQPGPPLRTRLLLNGPFRAGDNPHRLDRSIRLPLEMVGPYSRQRFYPVIPADPQKPHAPAWKPLPGYEKHPFNDLVSARQVTFERDFTIDPANGSSIFVCENIIGKIKVFCNGVYSGEYRGKVGIAEIPLKNILPGRNTLRLDFTFDGTLNNPDSPNYGILGDLYIEQRAPAYIDDVWIKTSWRKAALSLSSTLIYPPETQGSFRLKQYVIQDGRIKFELPDQSGDFNSNGQTVVTTTAGWRDPMLWSPAAPNLYTLISEFYCNDRLVDRKSDRFGFREFWIHGVDFFFNGKRIQLQGDVGIDTFGYGKCRDVVFPLLRADGVNLLRLHDAKCATQPSVVRAADTCGMFIAAQFYPTIDDRRLLDNKLLQTYKNLTAYVQSPQHRYNLTEYTRWFKTFRNHPSVIIWSVDNELMTPGCESRGLEKRNELVDAITNLYQQHMLQMDSSLVVTRDGDVCTYNSEYPHFDPRTPGNVHYPEFHPERYEDNWQAYYEYRPVIYGETLYCSYVWGGGRGARPDIVADKARTVREKAAKYRDLGIPAAIYMGVGLDGFVELKADGSGSPWKVAEVPRGQPHTPGWRHGVPDDEYPFLSIKYPAESGSGLHPLYSYNQINWFGFRAINWCSSKYACHVRNAVNTAYRETLLPQPPLPPVDNAEAILILSPDAQAFTLLSDGNRYGIKADVTGRAWFELDRPGIYPVTVNGETKPIEFKSRRGYASQPGFDQVPVINWKGIEK